MTTQHGGPTSPRSSKEEGVLTAEGSSSRGAETGAPPTATIRHQLKPWTPIRTRHLQELLKPLVSAQISLSIQNYQHQYSPI
jgi:hypothetical protein